MSTRDGDRGFAGIGVYGVKSEANVGTLWRSADMFGAVEMFTIGQRYGRQRTDTRKSWKSVPLRAYGSFEAFYDALPMETMLVGVELSDDARKLESFSHPERAYYLLGAEDRGIPRDILHRCHAVVQIATPLQGPGCCLNVATAGSLVLYDRHLKGSGW